MTATEARWTQEEARRPEPRRALSPGRRPDPGHPPDSGSRPALNGQRAPARSLEPTRRTEPARRPKADQTVAPSPHTNPSPRLIALIAALAGALTLAIRLALHGNAFDLFGDEIIYADLGRSAINGGFPRFGGPFFLHGPGFFYLEAGWAHLFGSPSGLMALIDEMRTLNALIAAVTSVAVVLLATRAGSPWSGAAAGLLFALDPFCIRQNDRVLLETALLMWVMLGYLVFVTLIGRSPSRGAVARAVLAGLFFGFAVLTKDEGALLTMLPLLAAIVLRWGPDRRLTLITIVTIVDVYVAYVTVVAANGYFSPFWSAKTSGLQRMLGVLQTTGFHAKAGGSLPTRLLAEATYFGTTYLLLALAAVAMLAMLRRGGPLQRMLGLVYCAAAVTLAYAVVLGTLEEQELYLLIVPSLLIVPVAATLLGKRRRRSDQSAARSGRAVARVRVLAMGLVLILGINLATGVRWWRQPDDGFALLLQYMSAHIPAGTLIGSGTDSSQDIASYALPPRYQAGVFPSEAAFYAAHVKYILVEWGEVDQGYSVLTPAQVRFFTKGGRVVFSFRGRTYDNLELYQMP